MKMVLNGFSVYRFSLLPQVTKKTKPSGLLSGDHKMLAQKNNRNIQGVIDKFVA